MNRARLVYSVGNEHNPGDPFGRSRLSIDTDGTATLAQVARGGFQQGWKGHAEPAALDRVWNALARSGFPSVPKHSIPGGATMRSLSAWQEDAKPQEAMVEFHAASRLPGYDEAFRLLDAVVWQLSEGTVQRVNTESEVLVTSVRRLTPQT